MTEDKLQQQIAEAAQADALLNSPMLKAALDELSAAYIEAWKVTSSKDTEGRERLWQAVQVVGKVRDHMVKVLNNGKLAKDELERLSRG